jgi:hypothetical protein
MLFEPVRVDENGGVDNNSISYSQRSSRVGHRMDDEDILFLLHQEEQTKKLSETWRQEEEAFQKAVAEYVHTSTDQRSVTILPAKPHSEEKKKKKSLISIQVVPKSKQSELSKPKDLTVDESERSRPNSTPVAADETKKRLRDSKMNQSDIEEHTTKRLKHSNNNSDNASNDTTVQLFSERSADAPLGTAAVSHSAVDSPLPSSCKLVSPEDVFEDSHSQTLVNYALEDTESTD